MPQKSGSKKHGGGGGGGEDEAAQVQAEARERLADMTTATATLDPATYQRYVDTTSVVAGGDEYACTARA